MNDEELEWAGEKSSALPIAATIVAITSTLTCLVMLGTYILGGGY